MQRSLRATGVLALIAIVGCSQLVEFNRNKIPSDAPPGDNGGTQDGGGNGGTLDGGGNGNAMDGALPDANMSLPDAGGDGGEAGAGGCDPATHGGCGLDQLCCDADADGRFDCVPTSLSQCSACGVACDANTADGCTERSCGCGWMSKVACSAPSPLCDPDLGACVECRDGNDCSGNPDGAFCFAPGATPSAQDNTCVACDPTNNAGCSGTTPLCSANGVCVACTVAAPKMCPGGQTCLSSGACECSTSADCTTPTAPICDGTTKQCRGCSAVGTECDTVLGKDFCIDSLRCSDCLPDTEQGCSGTTPDCRLTGASQYACQACTTNAHCENLGATDVCDVASGSCVQCLADTDCGGATPLCNTSSNVCVACDDPAISVGARDSRCDSKAEPNTIVCATGPSHKGECVACDPARHPTCGNNSLCCEASGAPVCEPTAFATQCAACDVACSGTNVNSCTNRGCGCGGGAACAGESDLCIGGSCVDCTTNSDCREPGDDTSKTFCDTMTNQCVACLASSDCKDDTGKPICISHACVPCGNDTQCAAKTAGTVCAEASGRCGLCDPSNSAECTTATTPICDATSLTCKACNASGIAATACDDKPSTPAECVTSGSGAPVGACASCDPADDSGCSALTTNDQCKAGASPACVDCDASGGCVTGEQCDTSANSCVDCVDDAGCTTSTRGADCNTTSHLCQCTGNPDCAGVVGRTKCNVGTSLCVECVLNADCAGNLACKSNTCQPCAIDADCPGGTCNLMTFVCQ